MKSHMKIYLTFAMSFIYTSTPHTQSLDANNSLSVLETMTIGTRSAHIPN